MFGIGVANRSAGNIHVNPLNVTLVDRKGSTHAYHAATHSWCTTPLGPVDVRPGDYAEGRLVFLISASVHPARIIYRASTIGADVVVNLERAPNP